MIASSFTRWNSAFSPASDRRCRSSSCPRPLSRRSRSLSPISTRSLQTHSSSLLPGRHSQLLQQCWANDADQRPTANEVAVALSHLSPVCRLDFRLDSYLITSRFCSSIHALFDHRIQCFEFEETIDRKQFLFFHSFHGNARHQISGPMPNGSIRKR